MQNAKCRMQNAKGKRQNAKREARILQLATGNWQLAI
jgi:hypothetical protein